MLSSECCWEGHIPQLVVRAPLGLVSAVLTLLQYSLWTDQVSLRTLPGTTILVENP